MARPMDDRASVRRAYRDSSKLDARKTLHGRFSTNPHGFHRWVFDQLELPPESRVLELGCGPGYLWQENLHRIPNGWRMTSDGLDACRRIIEDQLAAQGAIRIAKESGLFIASGVQPTCNPHSIQAKQV